MLTTAMKQAIEAALAGKTDIRESIIRTAGVSGGCINQAALVYTRSGCWFVKWNDARKFPGMFEAEARGLSLIDSVHAIRVPGVVATGESEGITFLILEAVIAGRRQMDYMETLGRDLAALHRHGGETFGLDHDNYIGSLQQPNRTDLSGSGFMEHCRFRPMVERAWQQGLISPKEVAQFESLYQRLPYLLPDEKPALLHGDLWNGNVITGPDGKGWLIDPAVYYGYRETDIAMTKLFGGFDDAFYAAYNEAFPLEPEWKERVGLFQLYPLLVHVNLFGRGYTGSAVSIFNKYI
jgi:fructosamine-3-kinase